MLQGKHAEAITAAENAVAQDQNSVHAWFALAKAYVGMQAYDMALIMLNEAILPPLKHTPIIGVPKPYTITNPAGFLPEPWALDFNNKEWEDDDEPVLEITRRPRPEPLPSEALTGLWREAFDVLVDIMNCVGWDDMLEIRARVFLMKEDVQQLATPQPAPRSEAPPAQAKTADVSADTTAPQHSDTSPAHAKAATVADPSSRPNSEAPNAPSENGLASNAVDEEKHSDSGSGSGSGSGSSNAQKGTSEPGSPSKTQESDKNAGTDSENKKSSEVEDHGTSVTVSGAHFGHGDADSDIDEEAGAPSRQSDEHEDGRRTSDCTSAHTRADADRHHAAAAAAAHMDNNGAKTSENSSANQHRDAAGESSSENGAHAHQSSNNNSPNHKKSASARSEITEIDEIQPAPEASGRSRSGASTSNSSSSGLQNADGGARGASRSISQEATSASSEQGEMRPSVARKKRVCRPWLDTVFHALYEVCVRLM